MQDLFNFTGEEKCLTHKILKCSCSCDGIIPLGDPSSKEEDDSEERDCQLNLEKNNYSVPSLRMNQLFQWEHYGAPIHSSLLDVSKLFIL